MTTVGPLYQDALKYGHLDKGAVVAASNDAFVHYLAQAEIRTPH